MTAPTIPIIDISPFLPSFPSSAAHKALCAAQVRTACEQDGFLQVTGHGVPLALQQRFLSAIKSFFSLPLPQRQQLSQSLSPCHRGYERLAGQKLETRSPESTGPDQKEGFSIGQDRPEGTKFLQGANQWPDPSWPGMEDFREVYEAYYDALAAASRVMFRVLAASLGLEEGAFDEFASDPDGVALCRAHRYEPRGEKDGEEHIGVGAHTDFGALTLLLQDDVGGLQVLSRDGKTWLAAPPTEGALVVNIGDMMQAWTGGLYRSTMHRVVVKEGERRERYSCAFFSGGPMDLVVRPLRIAGRGDGDGEKFEPFTVEDHYRKRYGQSYGAAGTELGVQV